MMFGVFGLCVALTGILPAAASVAEAGFDVESIADINYVSYGDRKLTLDLHRPAGQQHRPAIVLVHGGGWIQGDNKQ